MYKAVRFMYYINRTALYMHAYNGIRNTFIDDLWSEIRIESRLLNEICVMHSGSFNSVHLHV